MRLHSNAAVNQARTLA